MGTKTDEELIIERLVEGDKWDGVLRQVNDTASLLNHSQRAEVVLEPGDMTRYHLFIMKESTRGEWMIAMPNFGTSVLTLRLTDDWMDPYVLLNRLCNNYASCVVLAHFLNLVGAKLV